MHHQMHLKDYVSYKKEKHKKQIQQRKKKQPHCKGDNSRPSLTPR